VINGGLQIGTDTYNVDYVLPSRAKILNGLQNDGNTISLSVDLDSFSEKNVDGRVSGGAPFSIPIADLFSISIGGSSNYNWSKAVTSESSMNVTITWKGITPIGVVPLSLDTQNIGWWSESIIADLIKNKDKGTSVTGYQIHGKVDIDLGEGSSFCAIKSLLVSQVPELSITFMHADTSALNTDFTEQTSVSINLFGFIPLGSVSQSYECKTVDVSSDKTTVAIKFGPSPQVAPISDVDYTAYLLAGVSYFPGVSNTSPVTLFARAENQNLAYYRGRLHTIVKLDDGTIVCSSVKYASHAESQRWVHAFIKAYDIKNIISVETSEFPPINLNFRWPK